MADRYRRVLTDLRPILSLKDTYGHAPAIATGWDRLTISFRNPAYAQYRRLCSNVHLESTRYK